MILDMDRAADADAFSRELFVSHNHWDGSQIIYYKVTTIATETFELNQTSCSVHGIALGRHNCLRTNFKLDSGWGAAQLGNTQHVHKCQIMANAM